MANEGGNKKKIEITGKIRPVRKTVEKTGKQPANLSIDLQGGAIAPAKVPGNVKANRALNKLRNLGNKQKSVDGVKNNANKTLGQPEEDKLRGYQGLSPKNPAQYETAGGRARQPNRPSSDNQEDNIPEEDPGNEDIAIGQNGQQPSTAPRPAQQEEQTPTQEPEHDDGGDEDVSGEDSGPNIKKAAVNRAVDYFKKSAKKLFSKEAKTAIVAFIIEYWWAILIAIILIVGGFLLFNYLFGTAGKPVSETGATMTQAYDPAKDRPFLQAVLQMSGDKDVQKLDAMNFMGGLQMNLTDLKNDVGLASRPDKEQIDAKIDAILGDITTYTNTPADKTSQLKTAGGKVIQGVKDLMEMFGTLPQITAASNSPLPSGVNPKHYTRRTNLHDGTVQNPCPKGGCPRGHRTYQQCENDSCDAVDLSLPARTQILAAFGGKVTRRQGDGIGHDYIYILSPDGYLATYAHIDASVKVGSTVIAGDPIGIVASLTSRYGGPHLHFELSKDGKCITHTAKDIVDSKINNEPEVGKYLWQRMLKVLKATS